MSPEGVTTLLVLLIYSIILIVNMASASKVFDTLVSFYFISLRPSFFGLWMNWGVTQREFKGEKDGVGGKQQH